MTQLGAPAMPKIERVRCVDCHLEAPTSLMQRVRGALVVGSQFRCRNAVACRKRQSRVKPQFSSGLSQPSRAQRIESGAE